MGRVQFVRKGLHILRGRVPKCGRVVQNEAFLSCPSLRASARVAGSGGAFRGREWGTPGQLPAMLRGLFSNSGFYRRSEQGCSSTDFFQHLVRLRAMGFYLEHFSRNVAQCYGAGFLAVGYVIGARDNS